MGLSKLYLIQLINTTLVFLCTHPTNDWSCEGIASGTAAGIGFLNDSPQGNSRDCLPLPAQAGEVAEVPLASCIAWEMTLLHAWSARWTALAAHMARAASCPRPPGRKKTSEHFQFTWLLKSFLKTTHLKHLRQHPKLCPEVRQCYLLLCVLLVWPLWIFQSSGQQVHDLLAKKTNNRVNHSNQRLNIFSHFVIMMPQKKKKD